MDHDPALLKQAIKLLEQARILLPQNDDPSLSDLSICNDSAMAWFLLGEQEKGLELLKKNNVEDIFSHTIGAQLSGFMNRPEEAVPYLNTALLNHSFSLLDVIFGYVFVFSSRKDWASALAILQWGISLLNGLRRENASEVFDKYQASLMALLSWVQLKLGQEEASVESLTKAAALARRFDAQPNYSLTRTLFVDLSETTFAYDPLGAKARESVAALFDLLHDQAFSEKWEEALSHES